MKGYISLDIETVGNPWDGRLVCISYSMSGGPVKLWTPETAEDGETHYWQSLLKDPLYAKVSHTQYDSWWLRLAGYEAVGPFHDTQVMAHVLNENQDLDLGSLVIKYTDEDPDKRLRRSGGRLWFVTDDGEMVPWEEAATPGHPVYPQVLKYNKRDVMVLNHLYTELMNQLMTTGWYAYFEEHEVPFTEVLLDMQVAGLPIDSPAAAELGTQLEQETAELEDDLLAEAGLPVEFNINSPEQLAAYLFSKVFSLKSSIILEPEEMQCLKACISGNHVDCQPEYLLSAADVPWSGHVKDLAIPPGFEVSSLGRTTIHGHYVLKGRGLAPTPLTDSGKHPSTDTKQLLIRHAEDRWVQRYIEYSKRQKILSTYIPAFERYAHDGRLYGRFNQTGTKTGRLSSSSPNLQNIPARGELGEKVRSLFTGQLVVADYSQLEPRLMAHFSGDPALLSIYHENRDIYLVTAQYIFGNHVTKDDPERDLCKVLILALGYGAKAKKLAEILTVNGYPTTKPKAQEYLNHLQDLYSTFFRWKDGVFARVKRQGYVKTLAGRFRRLRYQFEDHNWRNIQYGERQAVNAIIQGSAGDVVRRSMVQTAAFSEVPLIGQVHDEVLFDVSGMHGEEVGRFINQVQRLGEEPAQHFGLRVPLVFEPSYCRTWAEKGGKLILDLDEEE